MKLNFFVNIILLCVFTAFTVEAAIQPIANYRFDECEYTGVANEVIDQLGTHNGRSFGGLDTFASGKIERAANFNAGGDRIEVSVPLPNSFSVTTWFKKPTATNGNRYFILGSMAAGGDLLFLDRRKISGKKWRWGVYSATSSPEYGSFSFATLDNNWHHLALVYSGSQTKLYIDGVFTDSVNSRPSGTLKYIGVSFDQVNSANPQAFRAPLDEFIVYNSALTTSEITTIYNNQAAGKNWDNTTRAAVVCGDLLGFYRFEQTSFAGGITDTSGYNHNGTNLGGSSIAAGKYCRGFDSNGSNSSFNTNNAFSSNIDLDDQVGLKGTISFWYKSNNDWDSGGYNGGGERTLFDASKDFGWGIYNKYFQLGIDYNGQLRFTFEDSYDNDFYLYEPPSTARSSNTWYYLSVTWDFITDNFQIYVNGSLVSSAYMNTNGAMKDLGDIMFGDNSSVYTANNNNYPFPPVFPFFLSSPYSANGQFDEVRIYKKVLTQNEIQTDMNNNEGCFNIDHYQIDHDGRGLTCLPETVTIKACTDANCSTLSTSPVKLNFQGNTNTISTPTFTGLTTVTFNHTVAETVNLSIANANISASNSYSCDDGSTTSCDIIFADTGFRFLVDGNAINIPTQLSGKPSNTGYHSANLALQAIKKNPDSGACETALVNNVAIELAAKCTNPTSCAGKVVNINGTNIPTLSNVAALTYNNVNLDFGSNLSNSAPFIFNYPDAGRIRLYARYNIPDNGIPSGNYMTGNSNAFVVRPLGFYVDVVGNPAATNANGTVFKKAGEVFTTIIKAVQWQAGDDTNNDAKPDTNASLSNNGVTPNFSNESVPESVIINQTLKSPLGGNNPTLANNLFAANLFTNGIATRNDLSWSEVGILQFDVGLTDSQYIGTSNIISTVPYVGRFTPDHFAVNITNNGTFQNTCSTGATPFTYIGQAFNYDSEPEITVTAQNSILTGGVYGTTKNYTQTGYQKLIATDLQRTFALNDSIKNGADNSTPMAVMVNSTSNGSLINDNANGNNGQLIYTFNTNDSFTYTKNANAKVAPFEVADPAVIPAVSQYKITLNSLTDSDGINAATTTPQDVIPTGLNLRFGRLLIDNAYGPETSDLPLPMTIQYWDGNNYVTNTLDSCTNFNADLTANYTLTNTGLNPALPTNVNSSSGSGTFASGVAEILLSKPNNNAQGQIRYTYDATPAWLLDDWDGDGNFDNKPSAIASFGIFRGNDRIIYWREIHQ